MKYYSTQRPLMPGCCPRAGVQEVVNFDDKKFCEEIGCEAWGFVEYNRELTQNEVDDYELTPAGIHTYWCVTTAFNDNGTVVSCITDVIHTAVKPEDTVRSEKYLKQKNKSPKNKKNKSKKTKSKTKNQKNTATGYSPVTVVEYAKIFKKNK